MILCASRLRLLALALPIAVLPAIVLEACGNSKPPQNPEPAVAEVATDAGPDVVEDVAPPPKSLYERLGGESGVKLVIDKFLENVTQDPAVNKSFKATKGPKLDALRKNLADQVCEVTGGPCKYAGKDMKSAHKGLKITDAQFDSLVNDLKLALAEAKVAEAEQNELVDKLAPLRDDIVEVRTKKK